MRISINGWGYENIRLLNTLDIDLLEGGTDLPHVTLVMMKNGTGKTTTLKLMRATLSGNAVKWSEETVREYQPIGSTARFGKFHIRVSFGSDKFRYTLILDYEQGTARYETSHVSTHGGLEDGHRLPLSMSHVLNNDGFVERFVFDGEQAKKTLSSSSHEAELAVLYLYQIDRLRDLKQRVSDQMQIKQNESASKGATSGSMSYNRTRRDNRKKNYDDLVERHSELKKSYDEKAKQKEVLEKKKRELLEADAELKEKQSTLNQEMAEGRSRLYNALQLVGIFSRLPHYVSDEFDSRLALLSRNMQILKLPRATAREFFNELADSTECVCGRPIGPDEKDTILQRAELYLGAEDLGAINAIKDKIRNYSRGPELFEAVRMMTDAKEQVQAIQSSINRLVMQLDEGAQKEAETIQQNLERIDSDLRDLDRDVREMEATPGTTYRATEQNNLQLAQKAYEEAEQNYQRALGTYEYTQKAKMLIKYIEVTESFALEKLKHGVIQKTNEKIAEILTDEQIKVDKIDGSLILHDRSAVSEGQTLAIAYSYIGSLFEHSAYDFPFVIDSPAASMDLAVRREVATIIPKLFKQLIIFVTSGEVAGFAEKFYPLSGIEYLTIEGQDKGENATCTVGQSYFSAYQSEEVLTDAV